ncbi:MAG TPA: PDZ domain-containing protein [Armatimonadota bacterium]|jgi:serine protease Do
MLTLWRITPKSSLRWGAALLVAPIFIPAARAADPAVAIAAVKPALVRILVAETDYDEGRESKSEAAGSGVIVSAEGYVVTNHHVAGHAKRLFCTLSDREQVEADLVGTDPLTDISVIKLRPNGHTAYPFAKWGDSSALKVGDPVFAMGSPMALSQSVTMGIVSNAELVMPDFASGYAMKLDGEDVGALVRWIGHDAKISPGNSGGPLANAAGEVIGINEISMGLGGAIPGNLARAVSDEIIAKGKVTRAWVGLEPQPRLKGSTSEKGVLIGGVLPGSPADKAGVKAGDMLVRLAGQDVSVRFMEQMPQFNQLVAALPIGQPVEAVLLRAGQEAKVSLTPQVREETEPKQSESKPWGIAISNVSHMKMLEMKRASADGVLVNSVRPGGPCGNAKPAIGDDDIIVAVNGQPVKDVAAFTALTNALVKPDADPVKALVTFEHNAERLVTVVKVGAKDQEDPGLEARKAYLPVSTQVLTQEIAAALKIPERKGFRITRVDAGSTAEKAGLHIGDLIVAVDGAPLDARQPEDADALAELIRQYDIGAVVELTLVRNGQPVKQKVSLAETPLTPREMKRYRDEDFEFTARDLSVMDKTSNRVETSVNGVYVEEVSEGGWAALGRLNVGDVILSIDGKPTPNIEVLREQMHAIRTAHPRDVVLHVARGVEQFYVQMETDWSK